MSDAQIASLLMASPFLLLSFVWAAGDLILIRRAVRASKKERANVGLS